MPKLDNQRWELFAQGLAKGKTADEAYQDAGYMENRHNASRLKTTETIANRVAELQNKAADNIVVTIQDIARQLDEDRAFALSVNSASAAVSATMGKAKVLGLIVDKTDANVTVNSHEDMLDRLDTQAEPHVTH